MTEETTTLGFLINALRDTILHCDCSDRERSSMLDQIDEIRDYPGLQRFMDQDVGVVEDHGPVGFQIRSRSDTVAAWGEWGSTQPLQYEKHYLTRPQTFEIRYVYPK